MKWADDRGEAQGGRTGGEGKHPQGRELHQRRDDLRCSDASVMLLPSWKIPVTLSDLFSYLFITFHVPTGPAHGRHRQM